MLDPVKFYRVVHGKSPSPDIATILKDGSKDITVQYSEQLPGVATKILYLSIYADELDIKSTENRHCEVILLSDSLRHSNERLAHLQSVIRRSKLRLFVKGKMTQRHVTLNWNSRKGHTEIKTYTVGPQGRSIHGIHGDLVVVYNAGRLDSDAFREVGTIRHFNGKSITIVIS